MNLFAIAGLLILAPLVIQLVLGSYLFLKSKKRNFYLLSCINLVAQIILPFMALKIIKIDAQSDNVRCGMPQAALFFWGIIVAIALVITCITQILLLKYREKK